jgi:hypothetical protein
MIHMTKSAPVLMLALALALVGAFGCNSATDDPDVSNNLVTVSSFDPVDACADYDGELADLDGDGTEDDVVYTDVVQQVNFDSRMRGSGEPSAFNDVIFKQVRYDYEFDAGTPPPSRVEDITVTVPAGGGASVGLTTILAQDVRDFIDGATRGSVKLTFTGEDAAGEDAEVAVGYTPVNPKTICGDAP